jgi:hypothetical protein
VAELHRSAAGAFVRPTYLFLYHVEFAPYANPPDTKACFEADLQAFLKARRLRCLVGLHGGMKNTYGVVYRNRWGVKEADRIAFAEWIMHQRICGTARLSELEEDAESTDLDRDITEWVFEVDNLTKADRREAAEYKKSVS